jgi:hypothetical protein
MFLHVNIQHLCQSQLKKRESYEGRSENSLNVHPVFLVCYFKLYKEEVDFMLMSLHFYFYTDPTETKTLIMLWDQLFYFLLPEILCPVLSVIVLQLFPPCNHL